MKKKKSLLYPAIFMLVLSLVLTAILAAINAYTTPIVEFNSEIEQKTKILSVFDIDPGSTDPDVIDKVFNENVVEDQYDDKPLYLYQQNGETIAYGVPFDGPGLWGGIEGYVGLNEDLKTVTGIEFIKQEETPGLGGRIEEPPYKNQFRNLDISAPTGDRYVINRPQEGGNIDAISGATQTSTFVQNMINEDVKAFIDSRGGSN